MCLGCVATSEQTRLLSEPGDFWLKAMGDRALVIHPKLVLVDKLTAALDSKSARGGYAAFGKAARLAIHPR